MVEDRNKSAPPMTVRAVGMVWYRREDYPAILRIMADADRLHATWSEWHKSAKHGRDHLRSQGHTVIEANIDPETFPAWCRARGLNVDAHARMEFANATAYEGMKATH